MQTLHPRSMQFGCALGSINLQVGTDNQSCSQFRARFCEVYDICCLGRDTPMDLVRCYLHLVGVAGSQQSPDLINTQAGEYSDKPRKI